MPTVERKKELRPLDRAGHTQGTISEQVCIQVRAKDIQKVCRPPIRRVSFSIEELWGNTIGFWGPGAGAEGG